MNYKNKLNYVIGEHKPYPLLTIFVLKVRSQGQNHAHFYSTYKKHNHTKLHQNLTSNFKL